MSLPKEPRQLMINLMYLVLTALLALNITREVLNAFQTIDDSIVRSNISIDDKNKKMYEAFDAAEQNPSDRDKVKPLNDKAKLIKAETEKLFSFLEQWKDSVVLLSGGYETKSDGNAEIKNMEDINAPTTLFVKRGKGDEIKSQLENYITFIKSQVVDPNFKQVLETSIPVNIDPPKKTEDNPTQDWTYGTFHNVPVVASIALLSKFQNDIKNTEGMVVEHLMSQVYVDDYKFDALVPIAVPNTSYALEGQEIEATIMLAAYNKSANPRISSSAGAVQVKEGVGVLKFKASGVGMKTINGTISIDKSGKTETYPYKFEYMVGSAGASMALDKMNVMYIGVPNPITISASGYNINDVVLNMPGAKLTDGEDGGRVKGHYVAHVDKQGTLDWTINAKRGAGSATQVGSGKVRVKYLPPPTAEVSGKSQGMVSTGAAKASLGVVAKLHNFDFDARFVVQSFRFVWWSQTGEFKEQDNNGALFSEATKALMQRSKPGDKWTFENVTAKGPDGRTVPINSVTLTLN